MAAGFFLTLYSKLLTMSQRSLFAIIFSLFSHQAVYTVFPSYDQVVKEFFTQYDLKEDQQYNDIRFLKKTDGYYLQERKRGSSTYSKPQLFWSYKKDEYKKLKFPASTGYANEKADEFLNKWDLRFFDLYPCYGYVNWELDAIDCYKKKSSLRPDEQYALGRAYSSYASNLINNNSSLADSSTMFKINEFGNNQLDSKELEKYRYYRHKAIEIFGKLNDNYPYYQTYIGSINTKYSNEYLTSFLDLRIYQNEEEAEKELPDSIYSPFLLEMAKNFLCSCDSNAILFTNGDNDTYPLLYLQAKKNYRTDVLVVNMSLLNNNNYINHFRYGKILASDSLHFVLQPENYAGKKLNFSLVEQSSGVIDLKDALILIKDDSSQVVNTDYPDFRSLISNNLTVSISGVPTICFSYPEEYIDKGSLMALDIISSNITDRPVYFIYNTSLGLTDNMELNGFAYKLVSTTDTSTDYLNFGGINVPKTFDQVMNDFNLGEKYKTIPAIMHSYQSSFCRLARYYADSQQTDSCKMVIDRYCELFPNTVLKMDYNMLSMIKSAYRVGLIEEGDSIASIVIDNMDKKERLYSCSDIDRQVINTTLIELEKLVENADLLKEIRDIETRI